jgi:hypothetical protein
MFRPRRERKTRRRFLEKLIRPFSQKYTPLSDKRLLSDDGRKTIERFVRQNATGKTFLEKLQSLSDKIQAFRPVERNYEAVKQLWCNRTAAEIILRKKTVSIDNIEKYNVEGCTDVATALLASARVLARINGINAEALFVRWGTQSGIRVKFEEQDWLFKGGEAEPVKGELLKKIEAAKQKNQYTEGYGPRAIGVNSIADFHKYSRKQPEK